MEQRWDSGVFWPIEGAAENTPAVILLPTIAGINDYLRRVARRLNASGYAVLAVDYYAASAVPDLSSRERILAAVASLSDTMVVESIRKGLEFLDAQQSVDSTRVGTVGFCIGGTYALLAGCQLAGISAAVGYYGTVKYASRSGNKPHSPIDLVSELNTPFLGHFGTADHFVSFSDATDLEEALRGAGKCHEMYYYHGAPHAFDEDSRPSFRPVASSEAWKRTLTFIDWYTRKLP